MIVSKQLLDNINHAIHSKKHLNQWQNSSALISWFQNIPDKKGCKFLKFDIVDFYPSITEKLLFAAISFAKKKKKSSVDFL